MSNHEPQNHQEHLISLRIAFDSLPNHSLRDHEHYLCLYRDQVKLGSNRVHDLEFKMNKFNEVIDLEGLHIIIVIISYVLYPLLHDPYKSSKNSLAFFFLLGFQALRGHPVPLTQASWFTQNPIAFIRGIWSPIPPISNLVDLEGAGPLINPELAFYESHPVIPSLLAELQLKEGHSASPIHQLLYPNRVNSVYSAPRLARRLRLLHGFLQCKLAGL